MSALALIHDMLIERDICAFVARDWDAVRPDFDEAAFTGYSGASGVVRLEYSSLNSYRDSWIEQADQFHGSDPERLANQLRAAQRLEHVELAEGRGLVTKVFDGRVDGPEGGMHLAWTTYYFLRFDSALSRWLITGFAGYLPKEWNAR